MDKIDREYMGQLAQEAMEKRDAEIESAGPLFDEMQRMILEEKISNETMLPSQDVQSIIDVIEHYAGRDDTPVKATIEEALEGHINKPAFVQRLTNDLSGMVEKAVDAREERIKNSQSAPTTAEIKTSTQINRTNNHGHSM